MSDLLRSRESNARTYARSFDRLIARAQGATLWDVDGREYIDCLACAGSLALGHRHPHVMERVQEFLGSGHMLQGLDIPTVAKHEFVERLLSALPAAFAADAKLLFCGPCGSDAVEAALKLFKTSTGRRSVLAFHGAYHGMTLGSLSLMGQRGPKASITGLAAETHFMPYPGGLRCPFGIGGTAGEAASLRYIDSVLSDPASGITTPALVIVEAVQGEGGCIPASHDWLRGLRDITRRHGIPLVLDEVQTGFCRTGAMFAFEQAGIVPDAVVMSKAVGGGFPLAVLAYHARYDTWSPGAHAGTFRGNQIAMVAGAATIGWLQQHDLASESLRKGKLLERMLVDLARKYPCLADVRGRGLMMGVEVVDPGCRSDFSQPPPLNGQLADVIKRGCFNRGLILETGGRHGAVLRFLPPLVISDDQLALAVQRLDAAISAALGQGTR